MQRFKFSGITDRHVLLFQRISPIYRMFFSMQVRMYRKALVQLKAQSAVPSGGSIIDIGCGTGALAFCLGAMGFQVTGIDAAPAMAAYSNKLNRNGKASFLVADALSLPFREKSFDCATASFVLHGLGRDRRMGLMREAARITRGPVVFFDYIGPGSVFTDFIERLEGGDYFGFLATGRNEMEQVFGTVKTVSAGVQSAWYVCENEKE